MNTEDKFKLIKELLAQGYQGSISEYIAQIEQQEAQAAQAQAQAEQQGQNPSTPTPALAGNIPTEPQQTSTERNIIQPGQYRRGGIKINTSYATGGVKKYDEGGDKKSTTEFVANAPIYDSQGQCWSNCGQRFEEGGNKETAPETKEKSTFSKWGHGVLDAAGLVPGFGEIADGVNALWYAAEGDKTNAALSTAAMIPFIGWGATAAKTGNKINKAVKAVDGTKDIVKTAKNTPPKWSKGVTHYGTPGAEGISNALKGLKGTGRHLDEIGFDASKIIGKNVVNHGNVHGRQIVEVALPGGKTQLFYKSSGMAGKKGAGKGGGTGGLWQPFGGHATHNIPGHGKVDNWFIKDAGYKDYYGSKSFRDIAGNLDRVAAEEGWDMSKQIVQRSGGVRKKEHGGPHDSDSTYTHIPSDSLIKRQQFNESRFKSDAVSPDGATSIAQIMPNTFADGLKKGYVPKGTKYEDLAKDDELATQFQTAYMNDLLTRPWNKGTDKVKRAKALAAYNMGPTGLVRFLNAQKKNDVDIYDSLDWIEDLNTETKNYVNNIMFGGDEKYEKEFRTLHNKKFKKIKKKRKGGRYDTGGASENIENDQGLGTLDWMQNYNIHTFAAESTATPVVIPYRPIEEEIEEEEKVETKKAEVQNEEVKEEDKNILNDTPIVMVPGFVQETPFVIEPDNTSVYVPPVVWEGVDNNIKDLDAEKENIELQKIQVKNARKKETEKVRKSIQDTMETFYQQYTKIDYDEGSSSAVKAMQQELVDSGYDLGKYGPNKDGIDGKFGNKTKLAYIDFMNKKLESKLPITFNPSTREEECDVNGCALYVTTEFMNEGYDVDNMGVGGDAWTMYDQIVSQGNGSSVYNIFNNPEFKNVSSHHDAKTKSIEAVKNGEVTKDMFQIGDIVGLTNDGSSNWDNAYEAQVDGTHFNGKKIKNKTYNSHVGFVSGIDGNGNPIVSHNISGKVYNDTWDNIHGGGVGWIARPNSTKSGGFKYDYEANTTEHDNAELLNFFDEKNYEGQVDDNGDQKRYTDEEKVIQNDAINFVKNNVPIILDELEIPINGEDGQDWLTNAVIGIGMKETGLGTRKNAPSNVEKNRKVNNNVKTAIQAVDIANPFVDIENYFAPGDESDFYAKSSLDPNDFSLGITKTKLSGIGEGSKNYYDINSTSIHTDNNKALAVTIDNFARNYRMLHTYSAENPQLNLTEEDIRNMTIIAHQRGLLSKNRAGGGANANFGKRHDQTLEQQLESLRSMYEGSLYDISSTNYRHLPVGGDYMYQREFGEHGAESYISSVNRYINRQVKTHEALALENKNEEEKPVVEARLGGYTSKYGY
jgi:hypothetical protein